MLIVVGLSGGSGIIYGVRFLEALKKLGVKTDLVMTTAAKETLGLETDYKVSYVESLATRTHRVNDIAAPLASGSFQTDGMVIIPASMKTVAGVASGYADNLLLRAAEVTLKERRPLIIVPRETPLSIIDLENLLRLARAGVIIAPAMPAFYHRPKDIEELVNHPVGKVLDLLKIENHLFPRWEGPKGRSGIKTRM
jgi:4-hydroxy-3-polyprenylbenzoate decarboxylase